jgi:hypothetical protein
MRAHTTTPIRVARINIDIPDDVHARLKMIAAAEGKGFYEWLKYDLTQICPDEETLHQTLMDIREAQRMRRAP